MKRKGGVDELRPAEAKLSEEARDGHGQRCPIFSPATERFLATAAAD
jgi:hypothetical protein